MRPEATGVYGLELLVHEALSYVWGLDLLVYEALSTSVWDLKLLVYEASGYMRIMHGGKLYVSTWVKILNSMLLRGRTNFCFYKILCFFSTDISKSAQDLLCRRMTDIVVLFFMPLGLDIRRRRGMTNNHWTVKQLKTSSLFLKYAGLLTLQCF